MQQTPENVQQTSLACSDSRDLMWGTNPLRIHLQVTSDVERLELKHHVQAHKETQTPKVSEEHDS